MRILFILCFFGLTSSCHSQNSIDLQEPRFKQVEIPEVLVEIEKSKDQWKMELTNFEYFVLRDKGTERPFQNEFWNNKKEGTYVCAGCGLPLFESKTKFKSGTGWPSFYEPLKTDYVDENVDYDLGYPRKEILCSRCGGHLGHVFDDGPKPTGLRYCINSISLDFVKKDGENN